MHIIPKIDIKYSNDKNSQNKNNNDIMRKIMCILLRYKRDKKWIYKKREKRSLGPRTDLIKQDWNGGAEGSALSVNNKNISCIPMHLYQNNEDVSILTYYICVYKCVYFPLIF